MSIFSTKRWPLRRCTDPIYLVRCSSGVLWSQSSRGPQQRSVSTVTAPPKDIDDHSHPFFNYTSGRWLYNETLRLIERRRYFSVDALCTVAAKAVGRSSNDIAALIKLAEGGSYRVFVVKFLDDPSIVVRLPYPSAVPRSYGLASEVATMMYLRSQGLPIPRIYDWSSSTTNEIGSEYMIMEKCPGQELDNVWYSMEPPKRKAIVEKIVQFESKLFALDLPAYGSIYFKGFLDASVKTIDLPAEHGQPETKNFCIGPSAERLWWYHMRNELNVHRGPWCSPEELLTVVASRESVWLKRFGKPRLPREAAYRSILKHKLADPLDQIHNLQDYSKIVKQLVPADSALSKPTLRHPDMSPNNIFVSDSGDITSVIDWEHSVALPQFLQAKMPRYFQNFGDEDSEAFKPPQLPEGFDSMPEDEKFLAADLYRRRQLHYYYLGFMHRDNQSFFQAMLQPDIIARNRLIEAAGRPWEGDSISLKAELIRTVDQWSNLVSVTGAKSECPIKYEQAEIDQCLTLDARQQEVDEQMQQVRDHLGINIDGWVQRDLYEEAKIKAQNLKAEMLEAVDTEDERRDIIENWPYQDHEEID